MIVRRSAPESFIFSTKDLVKMLHQEPEGGWRSYGKEKKVLNDHGLYELLESYGLESVHRRVGPYKFVRGLTYNLFHEKYGRHCRVGDPTLKSISDELEKEFEPPDDPSDSSGVSPDTPSPDPTTGDNKGEGAKNTKSGGTSGTQGLSPLFSTPYVMSFITEQDKIKTELRHAQIADVVALKSAVSHVSALSTLLALSPPPSTPAAGFCVPTHPERKLGVDLETFFPWPSEGEIDAQNRRRRKDGKAHPYAKDPRRNVIRLLTVNTGTEVKVFDLFTETVPHDVRDFIRNSTLIIHNADFDVTVLRRHGFEVSSSIFDTLLASQLLSLGEVEPKRRKPKAEELENQDDEEEMEELEQTFVLVSNEISAVVERFLGVVMKKTTSKLGGSDWSAPLSPAQLDYARDDVIHFHALEAKLTEELHTAKQWKNFRERSEFLVHLNNVKFAGIPVDREMLLTDKTASEKLIAETKAELREMFKDYRPEIPKSRRKKSKLKVVGADGAAVLDATPKTEEINPGYHVHVKAALAARGDRGGERPEGYALSH